MENRKFKYLQCDESIKTISGSIVLFFILNPYILYGYNQSNLKHPEPFPNPFLFHPSIYLI